MKRWVWVLALALALPAGAGEKKKPAPEKKAPPVEDPVAQAEEKLKAGDLDAAAELLRKAASAEGAPGDVSLRLGRVLEAKYELDAAMDAYQAAADKLSGPAKGEALGRLSVLQESRGSAEANATAEAAAAADPSGPWPTIALSRARARQGKADDAVALAEKVAASGGAAGSAALGYAQEARGELAAAEAAYRAALAVEPRCLDASVGLGRVLRKTGRVAEAEPILKQVIDSAPGVGDAYEESARVKLALGRPDDALADASIAAALHEADEETQRLVVQVKVARALGYLASNQSDFALQDLTALRDQKPELAEVRVGLARVLVAKRQADAALAELQKAVELKPDLAEAHEQLGFVQYALRSNPTGALPEYEKAVALDPGNVEYRTKLGAVLSDLKQYDRAVEELTRVVDSPGYGRAEAWIYLGRAHLGAKRYKQAIPPLEKAITLAPASADAYASLGWAYFGLKDAANFKTYAGKARALGYKEPTLLQYLSRVEAGEPIK